MNTAWAKEWVENYSKPDKLAEMYADDAQFEDVILPHKANGKEAIRKAYAAGVDPKYGIHTFAFVSYSGNADAGAVEWIWDGKNMKKLLSVPAEGKEISTRGVSVLTFKNGKIATQCDYWNAATTLRQLGAIK